MVSRSPSATAIRGSAAEDFPRFFASDVAVTFHGFHADGDRVTVEDLGR
ncbi:hypothetical protein [Amycolatopsis orientalis]|nr:hypothetical protein [Amycolatopsis orientalis]